MAGVAGPMLAHNRTNAGRFLAALYVGNLFGTMLVAALLIVLSQSAHALMSQDVRIAVAAVLLICFGLLDLLGRTPYLVRQVPQSLVRRLDPGALGTVWGLDLALLVTTQKTTSLVWSLLVFLVFLGDGQDVALVLAVLVTVGTLVTVVRSAMWHPLDPTRNVRYSRWFRLVGRASGGWLVACGVMLLAVILSGSDLEF